ncbi:MAG: efflux RND transporter periplasmic adaptor subunit [Candidatus Accumulibacter sp. UW20]|jgi:RND family efflux transporter MFP subunit
MKPIASSAPARQARRFPSLQRLAAVTLVALAVAAASRSLPAQTGGAAGTATAPVIATQPFSAVVTHPQREAAASVMARNESKISAEVGGVILHWSAEAGSTVKKGERLLEIDPMDFRLAEQRAQATLDASVARLRQAGQQLERARVLVGKGFFSKEALIQRETEVALMRSEVAANRAQHSIAARQLAKTRLHAPFTGSVKQRLAQTGEAVSAGDVLYILVETGAVEVSAQIAPADVAGLQRSREIVFASQGQRHPLRLLRVGSTVSAPARTQEVRLAFATGSAIPVPAGSDGRLLWRDPQPHLPAEVLVRRGSAIGVFVQQGSHASFIALPDAQEGRAVAVRLPAETRVVVRGQATLQDGAVIP